jgi:two-component system sporulation sensor kinase A
MFVGGSMINQAMFKQIFYQSKVPQMVGSIDFSDIEVNEAFYKFLGYSKEDWSRLSVRDISHPEDYCLDEQLFHEMLDGKREEYQIEKRYFHKSGMIVWGLLHVTRIEGDATNLPYILAQIMDITEKKTIEETYLNSEAKYRLLAEHSSDIINMYAADSTFKYSSPSVTPVLGYEPEELEGETPFSYIHPEDIPSVNELYTNLITFGIPVLATYRFRAKSGSYVWVESAIKPVINDVTGEITEIISVSRDIGKRLETEAILRKSEKLSVVGQLAASVAHEIRNPLTSIKGFMQLFQTSMEFCSPKFLGIVLDELKRVEDIISEFLTLAKPHQEKKQNILIDGVVSQVIQLLQSQAILINKEIHFEMNDTIPSIIGDPNSLKQVFVNIIQNALEAIQEKGVVNVTIFKLDKEVCVQVTDNGIGIPEERLLNIGEPFYSTKEKGTGLGLMTSYRIVEQHQGKIKIDSIEGEGTTVCICLPMGI